jgi:hypothetical protein
MVANEIAPDGMGFGGGSPWKGFSTQKKVSLRNGVFGG